MSPREKLQQAYELAFYPPRLHEAWRLVKTAHSGKPYGTALPKPAAQPQRPCAVPPRSRRMAAECLRGTPPGALVKDRRKQPSQQPGPLEAGHLTKDELIDLLKMALSLHLALPESGYASQRALKRLAVYQAGARAFGNVTFLRNILKHLGAEVDFPVGTVPPGMVRDIGLPEFCHHGRRSVDTSPV